MSNYVFTNLFKKFPVTNSLLLSQSLVAILYAAVSYIFLQLPFAQSEPSPVIWPSSGIGFIAVWFLGYRVWPGVWLGAFIAYGLFLIHHHGYPAPQFFFVSAIMGTSYSLEALLGVWLLRCWSVGQKPVFCNIKSLFGYFFSIFMACAWGVCMGTSALYFLHPFSAPLYIVLLTWYLADVMGILTVASGFLTYDEKLWRLKSKREVMVAMVIGGGLLSINVLVWTTGYSFRDLIVPFGIWATYRFSYPGAVFSIIITALTTIVTAVKHWGPFMGQRLPEDLLNLQFFRGIFSVTILSLAGALFERQQAIEGLKMSEARFRNLVENAFEVLAMVDSQGSILYTSPPTKNILGYDLAEVRGRSMFEFIHPDDSTDVRQKLRELISNPDKTTFAICRLLRQDGTWRWIEASGRNALSDPMINAVVIHYRDITERKLLQERFENVVESSPVAKIMSNENGDIKMVNKMAETLLGYTRDELYRMNVDDFVPQQSRVKHASYRKDFYKHPKARTMGEGRDLYAARKDGSQVAVEIALSPIQTDEGLWVLASFIDITKRKEAEIVLKRDKETLARMVDDRSQELIRTQNELKQANRLADIGTLAATVAHELRNPLGVIHLAVYNLRKEDADLADNGHLINIEKKVWEGSQIIDNLLSYARIKKPHYEKARLLNILDECAQTVLGRFAEKNIAMDKKYDEGLEFIEADSQHIREIFSNILTNACQALTKPKGKISIQVKRDGLNAKVSVEDSGVGIAPEDIEKVFDPFFTRKSKGTGLGMAIVNELVNMHKGRIFINSKLGEGTVVTVILPMYRTKYDETAGH